MQSEMKRKTMQGKLPWMEETVVTGKPYPVSDYVLNGILAFVFGYKVLYLALSAGSGFSPQEHIFTSDGNLLYGIIAAAVVLGLRYRADKKQRLPKPETLVRKTDASGHMGTITTIALISGFMGAKLFHILEDPANLSFKTIASEFFSSGGWTFYGGLICGAGGVLVYCYRKGLNLLHILDSGGPAMMLSYGIGRFGCHFSGDGDWGLANTHPKPFSWWPDWAWSYTYPHNVLGMGDVPPAGMVQIDGFTGDYSYELMVPVYPTPLFEALMGLALFFVLWKVFRNRELLAGSMFALYLLFAGAERFLIEFIREHGSSVYKVGGVVFSQAQMISVAMIIAAAFWLFFGAKRFVSKT